MSPYRNWFVCSKATSMPNMALVTGSAAFGIIGIPTSEFISIGLCLKGLGF